MRMRVRVVAAALGIAVAGTSVSATAVIAAPKPTTTKAKYDAAFKRGNQLFDQKKFAEARAEFEKAYAIDPRPVVLFNIASTYRREGDRKNALDYYHRYLDKEPNGDRAQLAKETIRELEDAEREAERTSRPTSPPPPEPASPPAPAPVVPVEQPVRIDAISTPVTPRYPRAVIDRPATMPGGTFAATLGAAIYPHAELDAMQPSRTVYDGVAAAQLRYALNDHVELAVEGDLDTADTDRSVVFGHLGLGLYHGAAITFGASATFGYDVGPGAAGLASFGLMLQLKLLDNLAIISNEDQLVFGLAEPRAYEVRIPIGLAYQLTPIAYAAVSTRLGTYEMRQSKLRLIVSGESYVAVDVVVVPHANVDAVLRFRAYDDGRDGVFAIRWRL